MFKAENKSTWNHYECVSVLTWMSGYMCLINFAHISIFSALSFFKRSVKASERKALLDFRSPLPENPKTFLARNKENVLELLSTQ